MKLLICVLCVLSLNILAEELDSAVAAEAVRSTSIANAVGTMTDNQQLRQYYKQLLIEQELAVRAAKLGLTEKFNVQHDLQVARRQVLVNAMRNEIVKSVIPPTETEMLNFYTNNLSLWIIPDSAIVNILPVNKTDKIKAEKVLLTENNVSSNLWAKIKSLKPGDTLVINDIGMVYKLIEFKLGRTKNYNEVKNDIYLTLLKNKEEKKWNDYLKKLTDELEAK